MHKAFQDIAQRLVNAEENFIGSLMEFGGITRAEATRVFDLYRREKFIKRDAVGGVYNVKHGAFLDRDVIRRALAESASRSGGKKRHSTGAGKSRQIGHARRAVFNLELAMRDLRAQRAPAAAVKEHQRALQIHQEKLTGLLGGDDSELAKIAAEVDKLLK
jgi:hypothetical protein